MTAPTASSVTSISSAVSPCSRSSPGKRLRAAMTRFSASVYPGSSTTRRIRSRSAGGTEPNRLAVATNSASDRSNGRSR